MWPCNTHLHLQSRFRTGTKEGIDHIRPKTLLRYKSRELKESHPVEFLRAPELKQLERRRVRSLNFTTQGAGSYILGTSLTLPPHLTSKKQTNERFLDRSHPLASTAPGGTEPLNNTRLNSITPCFTSDWFTLRAYPSALLLVYPGVWRRMGNRTKTTNRNQDHSKGDKFQSDEKDSTLPPIELKPHQLHFPLFTVLSKAKIHKSAVVRHSTGSRIRAGLRYLICGGARGVVDKEAKANTVESKAAEGGIGMKVIWDEENSPEEWVCKDWTYVIKPSLHAYRLPFPHLINQLRHALGHVNGCIRDLEAGWARQKARSESRVGNNSMLGSPSRVIVESEFTASRPRALKDIRKEKRMSKFSSLTSRSSKASDSSLTFQSQAKELEPTELDLEKEKQPGSTKIIRGVNRKLEDTGKSYKSRGNATQDRSHKPIVPNAYIRSRFTTLSEHKKGANTRKWDEEVINRERRLGLMVRNASDTAHQFTAPHSKARTKSGARDVHDTTTKLIWSPTSSLSSSTTPSSSSGDPESVAPMGEEILRRRFAEVG